MPFEPFERVAVGRTSLTVTRLGLGGASIGGLFRPVTDRDARTVVEHAWSIGIRSFDVAPLYGYGAAERRMGGALAGRPRDEFVLSTKVGRLVRAAGEVSPGTTSTPGARRPGRRVLRRGGQAAGSSSTTPRTASAGRSRRASSGSGWSASTSCTSTTRTAIGRPPWMTPTRPSNGSVPRVSWGPSGPA